MVFAIVLIRMVDLLMLLVRLGIMGRFRLLGISMFVVFRIVFVVTIVSMLRALEMILLLIVIWTPAICPVTWERRTSPYFGDPLNLIMLLFMVLRHIRRNKLQACDATTENEINMHLRMYCNWFLYTGNESKERFAVV